MWIVYLAAIPVAFSAMIELYLNLAATDEQRRKLWSDLTEQEASRSEDRKKSLSYGSDVLMIVCYILLAVGLHSWLGYIVGAVLIAYYFYFSFGDYEIGEYEFRRKWAIRHVLHGALELSYALLFVLTYALR